MASRKGRARFRVGDLLVQPDRLLVIADDGREIPLEPRMMDVLVALAENAGQTLSANRLLIDIWIHEFYGDNPVHKAIAQLRRAIGDDSRAPRYIETIRKRGYRLIAPVTFPEDYRRSPRQSDAWTNGSPYVGLVPFDEAHAGVFFGRNRMTAELLAAMRSQIDNQCRFVLIVGASGCGKTSLLRAGAIPLLTREGGFDGLRALSLAHCDLAAMHAGDAITALATALTTWTLCERPVFSPQPIDDLKKMLTERPESISYIIEEAFRRYTERGLDGQPYAHLLLTIDHAESLVATSNVGPETFTAFSRALQSLCDSPRALVTMIARSDFYPKLIEALPELTERKAGDGHLDVLIPRQGEISEIIRKPGILAGLTFEEDPQTLAHLDDVLRDAALAQPDALPLLQHTLQALYERRNDKNELTFTAYREIGGLEGAIAHRAEKTFTALPQTAQATLVTVLAKLIVIQPDNDAVSARRTQMNALTDEASKLVGAFINERLFVGELDDGCPTFGVAHEALLRQWPRAREWAQNNRRLLHARARLRSAADRWAEEGCRTDHLLNPGRPLIEAIEAAQQLPYELEPREKAFLRESERLSRKKRWLRNGAVLTLCIFSLISTTMALFALHAKDEAERQRQDAQRFVGYMLFELADQLRPIGNMQLLNGISIRAQEYLERQPANGMDIENSINYVRALRTRSEVMAEKGEVKKAEQFLEKSENALTTIASHASESTAILYERGYISYLMGYDKYLGKDYSGAKRYWTNYLVDSRRMRALEPDNARWMIEESSALQNLGIADYRQGLIPQALAYFIDSEKLKKRAILLRPDDRNLQIELIDTISWISSCEDSLGNLAKAAAGYKAQIQMVRDIILEAPEEATTSHRLANYLHLSALVELDRGDTQKARELIAESVSTLRGLTARMPENKSMAKDLVKAYLLAGDIARILGNRAESRNFLHDAESILRQASIEMLAQLEWKRLDANVRLALAQNISGSTGTAKMDLAVANLQVLAAGSSDVYGRQALAKALIARGIRRANSGGTASAREDWRLAIVTLAPAPGERDVDTLGRWAAAHILLGENTIAEHQIAWLNTVGYRHPDVMTILSTSSARHSAIVRSK